MKLFRELETEHQERILQSMSHGPLFHENTKNVKDFLMSSETTFFARDSVIPVQGIVEVCDAKTK